jgi:hypothetical protein
MPYVFGLLWGNESRILYRKTPGFGIFIEQLCNDHIIFLGRERTGSVYEIAPRRKEQKSRRQKRPLLYRKVAYTAGSPKGEMLWRG